jgi:hypothetical protein
MQMLKGLRPRLLECKNAMAADGDAHRTAIKTLFCEVGLDIAPHAHTDPLISPRDRLIFVRVGS